jgi:hypothetical protein
MKIFLHCFVFHAVQVQDTHQVPLGIRHHLPANTLLKQVPRVTGTRRIARALDET